MSHEPLFEPDEIGDRLAVLSERLFDLPLPKASEPAGLGTAMLNRAVVRFARDYDFAALDEFSAPFTVRPDDRQGRIDWVLKQRMPPLRIAIEIDRANKHWSLEKLVRAQQQGFIAIWVRWRSPVRIAVPNTICLINLFRRIQRPSA